MTKKNIVFIIPTLNSGGAEHQTIDRINALKNDYKVYLIILTNKVDLLPLLNIAKDRVFILESKFDSISMKKMQLLPILSILKTVNTIIKKEKINMVFAHLPPAHFVIRLMKIRYFNNVKLNNVHHSLQYTANPITKMSHWFFNKLNNILSLLADNINIFISNASREDLKKHFWINEKNTIVIHNGIKMPKIVEVNPFFDTNNTEQFNIVIAGRMVPEKGHLFFLEAFRNILINQGFERDIHVFFIGDGPKRQEIEEYIHYNKLTSYITLLGHLPREELLSYFKYSDLVIIPSISEGFGNVAVEAILTGATVLSSNAGGLKEIIEDGLNGFIYEHVNQNDLAEKIISLVNENRKIDPKSSIEYTYNHYSFDHMIEGYKKVIDND